MKEMTLEAKIENIPRVTAFIDEQLEALDCPMKAQMQIDVAIDELFGNISHYAYAPGSGEAAGTSSDVSGGGAAPAERARALATTPARNASARARAFTPRTSSPW